MKNNNGYTQKETYVFSVIFTGEVIENFKKTDVISNLSAKLNVSKDQVVKLFDASPKVVKKFKSREKAEEFVHTIEELGAAAKINITNGENNDANKNPGNSDPHNSNTGINELIKCPSCRNEISKLSESCPQCGAPNEWIHPIIKEFVSNNNIFVEYEFFYNSDKTTITGETELRLPLWARIVNILLMIMAFIVMIVFAFINGPYIISSIIFGVIIFMVLLIFSKKQKFKADVQKGEWESTDDEFWEPVKKTLKL